MIANTVCNSLNGILTLLSVQMTVYANVNVKLIQKVDKACGLTPGTERGIMQHGDDCSVKALSFLKRQLQPFQFSGINLFILGRKAFLLWTFPAP